MLKKDCLKIMKVNRINVEITSLKLTKIRAVLLKN